MPEVPFAEKVQQSYDSGLAAARRGDLLEAELGLREAADLLGSVQLSDSHDLEVYFAVLSSLANVLSDMEAGPEQEPYRMLAVQTAKQLYDIDPAEHGQMFAEAIVSLAQLYRGPMCYVLPYYEAPDGQARYITNLAEMARVRRERIATSKEWPLPWVPTPHWHLKGEWILTQCADLARRERSADPSTWDSILAFALNLLGEAYIRGERPSAAIPPLTEAQAIYRRLAITDAGEREMLADTTSLLDEAMYPRPAGWVLGEDLQLRDAR